MIGAVADRDPRMAERIRKTGIFLATASLCLFLASSGFILLRWWTR